MPVESKHGLLVCRGSGGAPLKSRQEARGSRWTGRRARPQRGEFFTSRIARDKGRRGYLTGPPHLDFCFPLSSHSPPLPRRHAKH
ncbi:hypothetical protein NDU88_004489 [Pleurodeles waltl]|uniref:Uncharacterized protein n=1 Tax=Pleurodeles waltl TaxID=8319 RepID=A0AAV7KZL7_PLEWA|nr:hypothetical protein NDU88_004489 [Pleurodeles waltl]